MESLTRQAEAAISKIGEEERASTGNALKITSDVVEGLQKTIGNQIKTDLSVLREDAYAQFAIGMESVTRIADLNPAGALKIIDDQAQELEKKITETYGDLGSSFKSKLSGVVLHQKLKYLGESRSAGKVLRIQQASQALESLASNSNSIPPNDLADSINTIHDAINAEYGAGAGELLAYNAYEVAKLRNNSISDGKNVSTDQPPVIPTSDKNTELNTKVGTNLRRLMIENPMLARGFLRIHGLTSSDALNLASQIREKFPDSPEPAAIETAANLRTKALQLNPLEYGANQLYYGITSSPADVFTGSSDHRFEASQRALELFGITNFFTEDEKAMLKSSSIDINVGAYLKGLEKLNAFNSKQMSGKQIDPTFFKSEFKKMNSDAVSWGEVITSFPQFNNVAITQVESLAQNMKASGIMPKLALPDQLLRINGIGGIAEKLTAANFSESGDIEGIAKFFNTRDNYAYPKTYEYGSRFQDIAMELLKRNIRLVNVGIDTYGVYKLNGEPLIINGSTVQYFGRDLEAIAKRKRNE